MPLLLRLTLSIVISLLLFLSTVFNRKGQHKGQVDIRKGSASLQTLEFTGGDNRDRTDDLLHAINRVAIFRLKSRP